MTILLQSIAALTIAGVTCWLVTHILSNHYVEQDLEPIDKVSPVVLTGAITFLASLWLAIWMVR